MLCLPFSFLLTLTCISPVLDLCGGNDVSLLVLGVEETGVVAAGGARRTEGIDSVGVQQVLLEVDAVVDDCDDVAVLAVSVTAADNAVGQVK